MKFNVFATFLLMALLTTSSFLQASKVIGAEEKIHLGDPMCNSNCMKKCSSFDPEKSCERICADCCRAKCICFDEPYCECNGDCP